MVRGRRVRVQEGLSVSRALSRLLLGALLGMPLLQAIPVGAAPILVTPLNHHFSTSGSNGSNGGNGKVNFTTFHPNGYNGHRGNGAGSLTLTFASGAISTTVMDDWGVAGHAQGGSGGRGGNGVNVVAKGGNGGGGGDGGIVVLTSHGAVDTQGDRAHGLLVLGSGGRGGNGGNGNGVTGRGGNGGKGGIGGALSVTQTGAITTRGAQAAGIFARSAGNSGGRGGDGGGLKGDGGTAGDGGDGGSITIDSQAAISTTGFAAHGIFAQSQAGNGGNGGTGRGAKGDGGDGGRGGHGGPVGITQSGALRTAGDKAVGVFGQSHGGTGGDGGSGGGVVGSGGAGRGSGPGGDVHILASGTIDTQGVDAHGAFAQSVGGFAGSGGSGSGLVAFGGNGSSSGSGGTATVTNQGRITTGGQGAIGMFGQSVGGGGGDGGSSGGLFSFGGGGNAGGNGGSVALTNQGAVSTAGRDADGLFGQSVGGGGGSGGSSGSVSAFLTTSLGGNGGPGGSGGHVGITSGASSSVATQGDGAHGLHAQSVGGGGGSGGYAVGASAGSGFSLSVAIGGAGGNGGAGGGIDVGNQGHVTTQGVGSHGILAESVGGGGGDGGFSIAASASTGVSGSFAMGGRGGNGGGGGTVHASSSGSIETGAQRSYGILAQSVGGGGGDGGFAIAGSIAPHATLNIGLGGRGGFGGGGGNVTADNQGSIVTHGELGHGILAQSVGGGGGSGGFSISGGVTTGTGGGLAFALGGSGGRGGTGGSVGVTNQGSIETQAKGSHAVVAQSVGGGGGSAGFAGAIQGGFGNGANLAVGIGGTGGTGGNAGSVTVTNDGQLLTHANGSKAVFAQSVGGGGGDGGAGLAAALGASDKNVNLSLGIGGGGGVSGNGGSVSATNRAGITTQGTDASGVFAQSVGGGGGTGGFSISGAASASGKFGAALGGGWAGHGGAGGIGGGVSVDNGGDIATGGGKSRGVYAQSVGGGGGDGGWSLAGAFGFSGGKSANLSASVGGSGGVGNRGGTAKVTNAGTIATAGDQAEGILAQSIGGGGGNGGFAAALGVSKSGGKMNANASVSVGGSGGSGGLGGLASVTNDGGIHTAGVASHGISAMSVGGGGGNGGGSFTGVLDVNGGTKGHTVNVGVSVGGHGGRGNHGGSVVVANHGRIETLADAAHGINAQSIGGGGGNGGSARTVSLILGRKPSAPAGSGQGGKTKAGKGWNLSLAASVGGNGGTASNGGHVDIASQGAITTHGADSHGIWAQSIGGGGGTGGDAGHGSAGIAAAKIPPELLLVKVSQVKQYQDWSAVVGGSAGSSGNGGAVDIANSGSITAQGDGSFGIGAQSIGGGGGSAGTAAIGLTGKVGVGGAGGAAGNGGDIRIDQDGDISTAGVAGHGVFVQSIGGGGGRAGNVDRGLRTFTDPALGTKGGVGIGLAFGRSGGGSGDGGTVAVNTTGKITTQGSGASGIFAQSIGGGGGVAGDQGSGGDPGNLGFGVGFAGSVGGAGSGGAVQIDHAGDITTTGERSHGVFAQSAGGDDGGKVEVRVAGDVTVGGQDADGIFAQSIGKSGKDGAVLVDVQGGTVQGGSGGGAAVRFREGSTNTLTSSGTVFALSGLAVAGTTGDDSVSNTGTLIGNLALGSGTNAVNNLAGGDFQMGPSVDLGGSGNGTLTNQGELRFVPGAIGQATALSGDLLLQDPGTYHTRIDDTGASDVLAVSGMTRLGGTVALRNAPGLYFDGNTWDLLTAGGGIDSTTGFSGQDLPAPLPLRSFSIFQGPSAVQAVAHVRPFSSLADNEVERAVAGYFDDIARQSTGGVHKLLGEIQGLPTGSAIDVAYTGVSPASYDDLTQMSIAGTTRQSRAAEERMRSIRQEAERLREDRVARQQAGEKLPPVAAGPEDWRHGLGIWMRAMGFGGDERQHNGYTGLDYQGGGVAFGIDHTLGSNVILGAAGGYSDSVMNLEHDFGHGEARTWFGSAYGTWSRKCLHLDGVLSMGSSSYTNERRVQVGASVLKAQSAYDGTTFGARFTTGCELALSGYRVEPYTSLQYAYIDEDGFQETGAGAANLAVNPRYTNSLVADSGLRFGKRFLVGEKTRVFPELVVGWVHDFQPDNRSLHAGFAQAPSTSFVLDGRDTDRNSLRAGASLRIMGEGPVEARFSFDSVVRGRSTNIGGFFKLGVRF